MCLAQRVPDENLFVLTPAPNIALELVRNVNCKINLTGGQLNRETLTLSGFNANEYVKSLNIDLAFMAASALSLISDFSCGDYYEGELKKLIIKKAQHVVVLLDSSKLNTSLPFTFVKINQIQTLITDQTLPEDYAKAFARAHVQVL